MDAYKIHKLREAAMYCFTPDSAQANMSTARFKSLIFYINPKSLRTKLFDEPDCCRRNNNNIMKSS